MSTGTNPHGVPDGYYCEHGVNPRSCVQCFHKPKPAPPARTAFVPQSPAQRQADAMIARFRPGPPPEQNVEGAEKSIPQPAYFPPPAIQRPKRVESLDDKQAPEKRQQVVSPFSYETKTVPIPTGDSEWSPPPNPVMRR